MLAPQIDHCITEAEYLQAEKLAKERHEYVTVYYREADDGAWWVTAYEALDQVIPLTCPVMQLALADIYEGVDFTQPAEEA